MVKKKTTKKQTKTFFFSEDRKKNRKIQLKQGVRGQGKNISSMSGNFDISQGILYFQPKVREFRKKE